MSAEFNIMRDFKVLPDHISESEIEFLVGCIAAELVYGENDSVTDVFDRCHLQPTRRAAILAAKAAVNVLLAHEIGNEINNAQS